MQTILLIFDIMGTLAFAVSGALVAIRRRMDVFGAVVLALVTATGGGILRDLMIGRTPPQAFTDPKYVAIAAGAGLVCFFVMYFHPRLPHKVSAAYDFLMFCFDTLGVAAFTVDGVVVATEGGFGDNLFLLVFLGVTTGIGGGMIRDILASRVPEVLQKHVYALASILGALAAGVLTRCGADEQIGMIVGFAAVVILRVFAAVFRWNLPKVGKNRPAFKSGEEKSCEDESAAPENDEN